MKTVKDKYLLVAADFAGYPLKEAVVAHLKANGWKITDVGVQADSDPDTDTDLMFHRIGLRAGAMIAEGEFERALLFCGTGMGIHIAASKCPHVHAGVVESVPAALRSAARCVLWKTLTMSVCRLCWMSLTGSVIWIIRL